FWSRAAPAFTRCSSLRPSAIVRSRGKFPPERASMIKLLFRSLAVAFVGGAALILFVPRSALAADPSVIEAARKERKLVIYTGVERAAAQAMVEAFRNKYAFIDAQQVRASSSKLATRLDAEIEANRVGGDLFEYSLLYLTIDLKRRGEILHYDSPEYAAYPK